MRCAIKLKGLLTYSDYPCMFLLTAKLSSATKKRNSLPLDTSNMFLRLDKVIA